MNVKHVFHTSLQLLHQELPLTHNSTTFSSEVHRNIQATSSYKAAGTYKLSDLNKY